MPARILILALLSAALLSACNDTAPAVAVVKSILSEPTPELRKAEIKKRVAAICPNPLTDDELERAASFIESTKDNGAVWIVRRLGKMDAETRKCRGI